MSNHEYDLASIDSIVEFARRLTGKSLSELVKLPVGISNFRNRGDLGSLLEKYYFKHIPKDSHGPDFEDVGLELKTTGLIRDSKGNLRAKERLVLTMINYEKIVNESWETSSFLSKCRLMLILFYLYSKNLPVEERKFILDALLYRIPEIDLPIIKRDWELIRDKVVEGKAHELSEGDTFYLGACRKGTGGTDESLQSQPYSTINAKTRAFSFKQSYLNRLIEGHIEDSSLSGVNIRRSIEEETSHRLSKFVGKSLDEIEKVVSFSRKSKSFKYDLIVRILSGGGNAVPELDKAEIELKTISLNSKEKPKEHMSFPGFKFLEIVEQNWEDSNFYEKLEKKFLFIVFKQDKNKIERLFKFGYWNMPFKDRSEAQEVWLETKRRVKIDASKLPKASENRVAHVRPKARNAKDKIITPQGSKHVRQCFWLNRDYIQDVIENQLKS